MAENRGTIVVGPTREDAQTFAQTIGLRADFVALSVDEARGSDAIGSGEGILLAPGVSPADLTETISGTTFEDRPEILLNAIGEGICLSESDGRAAWSNDRFRQFDERVRRRVEAVCRSAFATFASEFSQGSSGQLRGRRKRYNLRTRQSKRFFEVEVTPVMQSVEGRTTLHQVAAVVRDVTARHRMQEKINAIDRAGRELVHLEADAIENMHVAERLALLEEKVIRFAHDLMHFDHFAIRLLDSKSGKLELVMSVGLPPDATAIELYEGAEGQGISGYVAETGRSYICANVANDDRYVTGLRNAGSSLTVPLRLFDKVLGVFNIESAEVGAFTEDDRQFAEIFAAYLGMAIHMLNLLVVERYTTRQTATGTVEGELDEPLDDLIEQAAWLRSQHGDDDEAVAHIERILNDVGAIRRRIKDVAKGPSSLLGVEEVVHKPELDPVINGRRILVVDNEAKVLATVRDVLESRGAIVVGCDDGDSAITLLEQWSNSFDATEGFALVVSDINLGDRTGYDVFTSARKASADIPVILMTGFGYDPHHTIVRASQDGLQCVLFKPFQVTKLLDEVREAIAGPQDDDSVDA